ncbi:MAG TPA: MarR family transcriptional regulator [Verrucomicrobiae bacterium]|nr:MarR family transcriptional regulator [Verrucomicrobiae bacterium]
MENIERIAQLYPELMRVMGRIRSVVHEGMDLTYNQYKMLLTIHDRGSCTLNALARELRIAMSSASEMVDRLVNLGLVSRTVDGENRRRVTIFTTPAGEALIGELRRGIVENYRTLLARLTPGEQERLVQAIESMAEILGKL